MAVPQPLQMRLSRPAWLPKSSLPLYVADVGSWAIALGASWFLLTSRGTTAVTFGRCLTAIGVVAAIQLVIGFISRIYRGGWRPGSFDELRTTGITVAVTTVILAVAMGFTEVYSVRAALLAGPAAFAAMTIPRALWRYWRDSRNRSGAIAGEPLIIFGAGTAAAVILPALLESRSPYRPVALLDDDHSKRLRSLGGVKVHGGRKNIAEVASQYEAKTVLIAIPSIDREELRVLVGEIERHGLRALVLRNPGGLMDGLGVDTISGVTEADLLGRRMISIELDQIATLLEGRRVLVTGAGGSIGSELCRQIQRFNPASLVMLDRDESALHGLILSMSGVADLEAAGVVLCDIRDAGAVDAVFATHKPEIVFHAAALKHVPMLERFPAEALKTNVYGTQNVLAAAANHDVGQFINISTDKAANPFNILGYSKRATERLTSTMAAKTGRPYLSVRFGNVLGSRGSMLITFEGQIARGGPITVTHAETTRYFMMIEEAVTLTLQAAVHGRASEVLVLDMGEPVLIDAVAKLMASRAMRPIDVVYTGLRVGEKMHEDLFGDGEIDIRPFHPEISHAMVPGFSPEQADALLAPIADELAKERLISLCQSGIAPVSSGTGDAPEMADSGAAAL